MITVRGAEIPGPVVAFLRLFADSLLTFSP